MPRSAGAYAVELSRGKKVISPGEEQQEVAGDVGVVGSEVTTVEGVVYLYSRVEYTQYSILKLNLVYHQN